MPVSDQGIFRDRYSLIPRALVFLTRGDTVLLIKGAPTKRLWANLYNGVGGHIERGEDILTGARRELHEETGLDCDDLWLCAVITIDTGQDVGISMHVLRGECPQGEPVPSAEGQLEWLPIAQLRELPTVEDLQELLPRVLHMQPGDPPLWGNYSYSENDRLVMTFIE